MSIGFSLQAYNGNGTIKTIDSNGKKIVPVNSVLQFISNCLTDRIKAVEKYQADRSKYYQFLETLTGSVSSIIVTSTKKLGNRFRIMVVEYTI